MTVKPFGGQTLQAAIDRARACEITLRERKSSNYVVSVQIETAKLMQVVSTLVLQIEELTKKVETPTW